MRSQFNVLCELSCTDLHLQDGGYWRSGCLCQIVSVRSVFCLRQVFSGDTRLKGQPLRFSARVAMGVL
jgi:hypothetical protein